MIFFLVLSLIEQYLPIDVVGVTSNEEEMGSASNIRLCLFQLHQILSLNFKLMDGPPQKPRKVR